FAEQKGEIFNDSRFNLASIVMVPSVKDARGRNVLNSKGSIYRINERGVVWEEGSVEEFDAIIWCTGFGYGTDHLKKITQRDALGKIRTEGTRCPQVPGLWLVGYGQWTGFASATLIGVGRSGRQTVKEIQTYLKK